MIPVETNSRRPALRWVLWAFICSLFVSCATGKASDDIVYVTPDAERHIPHEYIPYYMLQQGISEDILVPVSRPDELRNKPESRGVKENSKEPATRIYISQADAWWLYAPQFQPPQVTKSGKLEKPVMIPRRALGKQTVIRVHLDEDGQVAQLKVLRGVDPELDELCRDAVGKSTFSPAYWKGVPLRFTFLLPCRWEAAGGGLRLEP